MILRKFSCLASQLKAPLNFYPKNSILCYPQIISSFHSISKKQHEISLSNIPSFNFRFIGIAKRKGMRLHKHQTENNSPKKRGKINVKYLHRVSNHNGLLKRIKIVKKKKNLKFLRKNV